MSWFRRRRSSDNGPMLIYATKAGADAAEARAAAAGFEPGYGSLRKGDARYIIFRGNDAEKAKQYLLESPPVTEELFYYVVETPNGNWGKDIDGLYLEQLLPWQLDTATGDCSGAVVALASANGVIYAARGQGDNFAAKVACGNCSHEWYDGLRYRNVTAVRCPSCEVVNKIDTAGIVVDQY